MSGTVGTEIGARVRGTTQAEPTESITALHWFASFPFPHIVPPAFLCRNVSLSFVIMKTSITISRSINSGNASKRKPTSKEIVSASIVL